MARRTYTSNPANDDFQEPQADVPPAGPTTASKAGSLLKSLAMVAASAIVGVIAVDIYRRFRKPSGGAEGELVQNPAMGQFGSMPGGAQVLPMPIPWPMPGFMQMPPQITQHEDLHRGLNAHEELELARLNTERAKAEALKLQMQAFMGEED